MKFYKLDEVPVYRDDQVFKVSPVRNAILTCIAFGIACACLVAAIREGRPIGIESGVCYFFAASIGLFALILLDIFRASLRRSNWLVRCGSSGVIIKYRSYQNWRLPADDVQAVEFDYSEITWVKMVKERRDTPGPDDGRRGTARDFVTYVDLGLVNTDTSTLETYLRTEWKIRSDDVVVHWDYPVQVLQGGVVEIRWSGGIHPSARRAVEFFGRQQVKVLEPEHRKTDLTHHRNASREEERAKIVTLARNGEEVEAEKLARQVYGYSSGDAYEFVRNLVSGETKATN